MSDTIYSEAIDVLQAALQPLDHPDKGIGYSWGMRRGQAGYFIAVSARDQLRRLRDELLRYQAEYEGEEDEG